MDQGDGTFTRYADFIAAKEAQANTPLAGGIFTKGEILEIKGSRFKVIQILDKGLKLSLLPKDH
jgi:hypothetical protein